MINPFFVLRPPLNTFERTHVELDTPWTSVLLPPFYARADRAGRVFGLSETTAILTAIRLANTSTSPRVVDLRVLTVAGPTFRASVTAQTGTNTLRIERDQKLVAANTLRLFTVSPLAEAPIALDTASFPNIGHAVAWNPDSRHVAIHNTVNRLEVFDALTGARVLSNFITSPMAGQTNTGIAWSSDGEKLALSYAGTPGLLVFDMSDMSTPTPVTLPTLPSAHIRGATWGGPSNRYLFCPTASAGTPYIMLDWHGGTPVRVTFSALSIDMPGAASAWSPNGRYLAFGSTRAPFMRVFDWDSGSPVLLDTAAFSGVYIGTPTAVGWSPDSTTLVVGGQNAFGRAQLHAFSIAGTAINRIEDPPELPDIPTLWSANFSPDGSRLCVCHRPAQRYAYYRQPLDFVLMYDWPTRTRIAQTLMRGVGGSAAAWSPDGNLLAVAGWRYDRHYPPTGVDKVRLLDSSGNDHVVNGSFEDTTGLTPQPFGFTGNGGVPGWTSAEAGNTIYLVRNRVFNVTPTEGQLWLDLVSQSETPNTSNNVQLEQTFDDLTAGESYRLELDVLAAETSSVAAGVFWNGVRVEFDGAPRIPPVVPHNLIRQLSVPPGQVVTVPIRRAILGFGDRLQARASGSGVTLSAMWLLSTDEEVRLS